MATDAALCSLIIFATLTTLPQLAFTISRQRVLEFRSDGNFDKRVTLRGGLYPPLRGRNVKQIAEKQKALRLLRARVHEIDQEIRATSTMECRRKLLEKNTNISVTTQRIPSQVVLTGRNSSLDDIHPAALANIKNVSGMSPNLSIRWLGDQACLKYLEKYFDQELVQFFRKEAHGAFRGDICRTAVLLREGGFYMDLDVQLILPLTALIDNATTFMAIYEAPEMSIGGMLNALMAVEPGSPVMNATLNEIRLWYRQEVDTTGWMGPVTLLRGLNRVVKDTCPCESVTLRKKFLNSAHNTEPQWQCGSNLFRLNVQRRLFCESPNRNECPESRGTSGVYAVQQGFFLPGRDRVLIGWPRPAWCKASGCGYGGLEDHNISEENPV